MKVRSLVLILTLLSVSIPVPSQLATGSPPAVLVRRFEMSGSSADTMMESALDVAFAINNRLPEKAVVRLCSKRPIPIAIATAAADPLSFARSMHSRALPFDRIIISRSEECLGKAETTTATELWAVPSGGSLPPGVESIKSCQIKLQYIKSEPKNKKEMLFVGTYDHKKSIEKLISELNKNPNATGIVIGYYLKGPKRILKIKLQEAKRMLAKSGLPEDRYFLHLMPWPGFPESLKPEYLSVAIIDIVPECLQLPPQDEVVIAKGPE